MSDDAPSIVSEVQQVTHPPTWRGQAFVLNFMLLEREPTGPELLDAYRWARAGQVANARAISPRTLDWASLFHPRFFDAIRRTSSLPARPGVRLLGAGAGLLPQAGQRALFWLQSLLFLAAVTMSAAIVQGRWSAGTLGSKFDRLWQAAEMGRSGVAPALAPLGLDTEVRALAAATGLSGVEKLLAVRRLFEAAIGVLSAPVAARRVHVRQRPASGELAARFGFVDDLRARVPGLQAAIVYGSSVASMNFADYDLVLVVNDAERALRQLANTSPSWRGKEINLGIYTPAELWRMQLLSGDNLADYGLCLYGEAELPDKPVEVLLARNLSFGTVRLRQQLGMVANALGGPAADGDDRRNLYHYFVKIPANIAKGTFGAVGRRLPKEEVQRWLSARCGFDTAAQQALAARDPAAALSCSAVATTDVLRCLNDELQIVGPALARAQGA